MIWRLQHEEDQSFTAATLYYSNVESLINKFQLHRPEDIDRSQVRCSIDHLDHSNSGVLKVNLQATCTIFSFHYSYREMNRHNRKFRNSQGILHWRQIRSYSSTSLCAQPNTTFGLSFFRNKGKGWVISTNRTSRCILSRGGLSSCCWLRRFCRIERWCYWWWFAWLARRWINRRWTVF